jgi:hypothetical protein
MSVCLSNEAISLRLNARGLLFEYRFYQSIEEAFDCLSKTRNGFVKKLLRCRKFFFFSVF